MGMAFIMIAIYLAVVGFCTIVGGILLIVSAVMKKKQKKRFMIPRVIGIIFMLPLILSIVGIVCSVVSTNVKNYNSLAYNVSNGNYRRVEQMLKKGVCPDCTEESNEPASNGKQTLLSVLCERGGFWDSWGDPVDNVVTEEELAMIQLLIDYGADIEAVSCQHSENNSRHRFVEEKDYYLSDDRCGYTPLMYAVHRGEPELTRLLVENGADVNAKDYCGFTPVMTVADNLDDESGEEILRYLIDHGARTTGTTNFGQTAEFLAFRNTVGTTPLDNENIREILSK